MATTWSQPDANTALAVCTTGTEAAPTLATEGLALDGAKAVMLTVEAGGAIAASNLNLYWRNPLTGVWSLLTNVAAILQGGANQEALLIGGLPGNGRLAALPSGLAIASSVYHFGVRG